MIAELLIGGFFSAIGWWSANHYVIEPVFEGKPATVERKDEREELKQELKKEIKKELKEDKKDESK